jgi:hypothetical protein
MLPKEERAVVFVSGHILNQISVFMKLVRFSTNHDPTDTIEGRASGMQSQIILRSLMAVLSEACVYFGKRKNLIETYIPYMHEEGRNAYGKLTTFFDKRSLLRLIRNNYLYHYPNEKNVDKAFEAIPEDEPWEWYFSVANTNSLYFSCELVLGYGLMEATGEPTPLGAFGVVMAKTMELANIMPDFLVRLIEVIGVRNLGTEIFKPHAGTKISDAPALRVFWLPFFCGDRIAAAFPSFSSGGSLLHLCLSARPG